MTNVPVEALSLQLLFAEEPAPSLLTAGGLHAEAVPASDFTAALRQTWDWKRAEVETAKARFALLVQDKQRQGVAWQRRWRAFRTHVASLLLSTDCVAIHAPLCQRLVDPVAFLEGERAERDHLCGAVNVRIYEVEDHGPGVLLMDTLGLHALGLPDLQCVARGLEPNDVAALLWDYAYYLYEKGDVIQDGHDVRGLREQEHWTCGRQWSLAPPQRVVLDLYPGPDHEPVSAAR